MVGAASIAGVRAPSSGSGLKLSNPPGHLPPCQPPTPPDTSQAIPDWRGQQRTNEPNEALTETSIGRFKDQVHSFLSAGQAASAKSLSSLAQSFVANKHLLVGLDNALVSGVGYGFARFLPARRVGRLCLGERRYFIPLSEVPEALRKGEGEISRRSCIIGPDGSTRLEVNWHEPRPSLGVIGGLLREGSWRSAGFTGGAFGEAPRCLPSASAHLGGPCQGFCWPHPS